VCLHPMILLEPVGVPQPVTSLTAHFAALKDPRVERTKAHALSDILVLAICAIIAGANDWEAVAEFARSKAAWFKTFLALPLRPQVKPFPALSNRAGRVMGRVYVHV